MLQIFLLIIGIVGLVKRKIKITSKREIAGAPVILLSCFYLLMLCATFFYETNLITVGIIGLVTIIVLVFFNKNQLNTTTQL